jgi:hypothetical protein
VLTSKTTNIQKNLQPGKRERENSVKKKIKKCLFLW